MIIHLYCNNIGCIFSTIFIPCEEGPFKLISWLGCEGHRLLENIGGRDWGFLFTICLCTSLHLKGHAIHPKPKGRFVVVKGEILRVLQTRTGSLGALKDQIQHIQLNTGMLEFYQHIQLNTGMLEFYQRIQLKIFLIIYLLECSMYP